MGVLFVSWPSVGNLKSTKISTLGKIREIWKLLKFFILHQKRLFAEAVWNFTWPCSSVGPCITEVHIWVLFTKVCLIYVGWSLPHSILNPTLKSNILKQYCCKRDKEKFLSCCREFELSTEYVTLLFSFALLKPNPSGVCMWYTWCLFVGVSESSFQNKLKHLLYPHLPSLTFFISLLSSSSPL